MVRPQPVRPFKRVEKALISGEKLLTTTVTSQRMARVRQQGTAPELAVRAAARVAGLRFTVHNADLTGSPDLANRSRRVAIFVHGCYWHRHPGCAKATVPKSNRTFWLAKFERNRARDRASVRALRRLGFWVLIIWECKAADPVRLAHRLQRFVTESLRRSQTPSRAKILEHRRGTGLSA